MTWYQVLAMLFAIMAVVDLSRDLRAAPERVYPGFVAVAVVLFVLSMTGFAGCP